MATPGLLLITFAAEIKIGKIKKLTVSALNIEIH